MRKNIWNKLIGLALLMVSFVACDTADQDTSPIISPDNKPLATFSAASNYSTINEGDTVVYNVTIDKTIDRALTVSARIVEGTGDEDDIIVKSGTIAPYRNSTVVTVIFPRDWDAEETETLKIEFGIFSIADRYLVNPATVNPKADLSITNYVSDTLEVTVDWAQDIPVYHIINVKVNSGTYQTILRDTVEAVAHAENLDYDIFVSPSEGFDINDPWSSDIVDAAATGDHPEILKLIDLADGEYVIWADLWANGVESVTAPTTFYAFKDSTMLGLVTSFFGRQGTELIDYAVTQDSSQAPLIFTPGFDDDGTESDGILAKVVVAGGKYNIIDYVGTESGSFKTWANRTPRPSKYMK